MEYCDAYQCDRTGALALAAARELLRLHQAGIVDRDVLRERLDTGFPLYRPFVPRPVQ